MIPELAGWRADRRVESGEKDILQKSPKVNTGRFFQPLHMIFFYNRNGVVSLINQALKHAVSCTKPPSCSPFFKRNGARPSGAEVLASPPQAVGESPAERTG